MMENTSPSLSIRNGSTSSPHRRSVGVTIFGIWFIITAVIIWLPNEQRVALLGPALLMYGKISSIILLLLAIQIFRLKEWARKGIILYHIITGLISLFLHRKVIEKVCAMDFGIALADIPTTYFAIAGIFFVLYAVVPIYFFTRPKVKRQFTGAES